MDYSYIEEDHKNMPLPQSRPNGGLYTGATATGDWGAVPVVPEAHVYLTENLKSAGPPPGAIQQPAGFMRPGNSTVLHPYHQKIPGYVMTFIQ